MSWREKASLRELRDTAAVSDVGDFWRWSYAMASPGTPTLLDRHSKRVLVDTAEWRDRLEQLAEMRRAAAALIPSGGAVVDIMQAAP
jgi:hypothetical protein